MTRYFEGVTALDQIADRTAREREYHNERFHEETRVSQDKYYWALRSCHQELEQRVAQRARAADILEYGCALGDWSLRLAPTARSVCGIDISDVAIENASVQARTLGLRNTSFQVMDAQATSFQDNSFDLVFGSGIIHHLDTETSLSEIYRVLRPGGVALFKEPLGSNVLINLYRRLTPSARTADEHPLLPRDQVISKSVFDKANWRFHGLTTLGVVPLRGTPVWDGANHAAVRIDRLIAKVPGLRWQMWHAILELQKG